MSHNVALLNVKSETVLLTDKKKYWFVDLTRLTVSERVVLMIQKIYILEVMIELSASL